MVKVFLKTHAKKVCEGEWCCLHNPSGHRMNKWPITLREDRNWLAERTCEHGVGHPDPDSLAHIQSRGIEDDGTHGCCAERCCTDPGT